MFGGPHAQDKNGCNPKLSNFGKGNDKTYKKEKMQSPDKTYGKENNRDSLQDPTLRTKMAVIKNCQIFDIGDLKVFSNMISFVLGAFR